MRPADTITGLPPPPPGVSVRAEGSRVHIELRHQVARWLRWTAGLGCLPGLLAGAVVAGAAPLIFEGDRPASWPLIAAAVVALLALCLLGLLFLLAFIVPLVRGDVVFDGETLAVHEAGKRFAMPRGDVRGVRVTVRKARALDLDLAAPPHHLIVRRPSYVLEVELPDGQLWLFRNYDDERLLWVGRAVRAMLELPDDVPLVATADPADTATIAPRLGFHVLFWGGLLCLAMVGSDAWRAARSHGWPTVEGHVVESQFVPRERRDGGAPEEKRFRYAYRVGDAGHVSDHIGYWREPKRAFVEAHPTGSPIRVHYDPAHPNRSVVVPGVGGLIWLVIGSGGLCFLIAVGLLPGWPTPAQEALLRRYRVTDDRPGAVFGVTDDAADVIQWDAPADLRVREVRHWRREHVRMSVRVAALVAVGFVGMYAVFGPFVPPLLWGMLALVTCGFAGMFAAQALTVRVRPTRPATYRISAVGIEVPRRETPLWPWEWLADFRIEPHPLDPAARVARVRAKSGKRLRLPLPPGEAGDRAARALRERLPEVMNPEGDWILRRALAPAWVAFGLLLAVVVGGLGGEVAFRHRLDLLPWRRVILLVALLAGPGTWWALCARARFGRAPVRFVALVFNFVALAAGVLWHLRRSIPAPIE